MQEHRRSHIQALVLAESSAEPYANEVAKFIRGILFLGTPLEGSSKTKWAKAGNNFVSLYKRTNSEHVAVIEENSIKLGDIGAAFLQLLRKRREAKEPGRKIEIVCFFEEQETAIGLVCIIPCFDHSMLLMRRIRL